MPVEKIRGDEDHLGLDPTPVGRSRSPVRVEDAVRKYAH
jgi:hypothetical protein